MYQTRKLFIQPDMQVADIITDNPTLMLILEHFEISLLLQDKTVATICEESAINPALFISFANLYNGFNPTGLESLTFHDLHAIITYLRNNHHYYLIEKYPRIRGLIEQMYHLNEKAEILMVEKFFDEYFKEVKDHLQYEDQVVFPYIRSMLGMFGTGEKTDQPIRYSVSEYKDHHYDIEDKLADLKSLLFKHLPIRNDQKIRRELLLNLFELVYDLNVHTRIEDEVLIPLVQKLEQSINLQHG